MCQHWLKEIAEMQSKAPDSVVDICSSLQLWRRHYWHKQPNENPHFAQQGEKFNDLSGARCSAMLRGPAEGFQAPDNLHHWFL